MKYILTIVLLVGGLFVYAEDRKVVLKDAIVFKVAQTVFTMVDLEEYYRQANNLKCIYPESIISRIFTEEFLPNKKALLTYRKPFTDSQKNYFKELIEFAKLLIYSESQKVVVKPSITKYFYLNAKNSGCSIESFSKTGELEGRLKELVRLEVFSRSRFLPSERSGLATEDDIEKAIISAKNLLKSIGKQIDDEFYW